MGNCGGGTLQTAQGLRHGTPYQALERKRVGSDDFDPDDDYVPAEIYPGERIGHPLDKPAGTRLLRWSVAVLIALGGGWVLLDDQATLPAWPFGQTAFNSPAADSKPPAQAPPAAELPPLPAQPVTPIQTAGTPVAAPAPAAAEPSPAEPTAAAAERPEPLAPPTIDESDPNQKRAAAAGLHPGVSAAVLKRLSQTDYRNAGIAISTAIAEAPDTEIFVWPKKMAPELALFQVRFVASSNPDCRRYIVNVTTKDGWSTTAPAMEKCGDYRLRPKANKASVE